MLDVQKQNRNGLHQLEKQVDNPEQYGRRENLEIHEVPMMQKKNTNQIIKTIAKCLYVPLDDVNISTSHRMPVMSKKRPISNTINRKQKSNSKSTCQHLSLIVSFSNRDKKNEIFKRKKMLINNEKLNSVFWLREYHY